jgi:hypothetical protein
MARSIDGEGTGLRLIGFPFLAVFIPALSETE